MTDLAALLARRAHLPQEGTTVYRGVHTTETAGQFALDIAGDAGVLSLYAERSPDAELELARDCAQAAGQVGTELASVYLKRRPASASHAANVQRDHLSPAQPVWGEERPEVVALEGGAALLVRPGGDLSVGLFTDARPARAWVRGSGARRVLNLFAYTCGFGLNAALGSAERSGAGVGGAEVVKNVDLSRKVLAWGQENYALNGLPAPNTDFLYGDVFGWLTRLARRGDAFDLVILDPPSFARSRAGTWRAERDYAALVSAAAAVTAPGGGLLTLLNHAGVSPTAFDRLVEQGLDAAGRRGRVAASPGPGEDYPQATHLKARVWSLDLKG